MRRVMKPAEVYFYWFLPGTAIQNPFRRLMQLADVTTETCIPKTQFILMGDLS